ncbi:hypothetical protein CYMTET_41679 [Cymbomonas tetramitiformis]|uniref:Uncharacterized protein n=1 Tax=Cymbomonas tetramitiformis TaxID=36881 RepID=A0AAE0F2A0_9CHLO|nr:hypothetical protein CYMTET_41679 [Cymbomonas tetramitiformis]
MDCKSLREQKIESSEENGQHELALSLNMQAETLWSKVIELRLKDGLKCERDRFQRANCRIALGDIVGACADTRLISRANKYRVALEERISYLEERKWLQVSF